MANYLLVKVDANEDDYLTEFNAIGDHDLETIKPLIEKIKACKEKYNFPNGMLFDEDGDIYEMYADRADDGDPYDVDEAIEVLMQYVPVTEDGFHSIVKIEVYDVGHVDTLFYHNVD